MANTIQLLSFKMITVNLDQNPFEQNEVEQPASHEPTYDIFVSDDDSDRFLMILNVKGAQGTEKGHPRGLSYEITGGGEFKIPENLTPEQKYKAITINGGSMLYGLIRGQVMLMTGSFPGGSFLLPTLNWPETVKEIEKKRVDAETQEAAPDTKEKLIEHLSDVSAVAPVGGRIKATRDKKPPSTEKKPTKGTPLRARQRKPGK